IKYIRTIICLRFVNIYVKKKYSNWLWFHLLLESDLLLLYRPYRTFSYASIGVVDATLIQNSEKVTLRRNRKFVFRITFSSKNLVFYSLKGYVEEDWNEKRKKKKSILFLSMAKSIALSRGAPCPLISLVTLPSLPSFTPYHTRITSLLKVSKVEFSAMLKVDNHFNVEINIQNLFDIMSVDNYPKGSGLLTIISVSYVLSNNLRLSKVYDILMKICPLSIHSFPRTDNLLIVPIPALFMGDYFLIITFFSAYL
ncbi:hypothetical protein L9F63_000130, partial [Diploptera punctata]